MSGNVEKSPNVLEILKEASAQKLVELLKIIEGKKDLVLDKEIICSLDYIASFTLLKACGVEKIFKLEPGPSPGHNLRCVYVIRPSIHNARIISDHINANLSAGTERQYWLLSVPHKLFTSEKVLEREGVYGYIYQLEFPLGFVTLEKDLVSLEINDFFKSFFLKGDLKYINVATSSLVQLCKVCGPIPKVFGQGRCAKMVIDMMSMMMQGTEFSATHSQRISHLIVLDRDIDYASVLLSQLTYEGVLDETFGINSGRITFPKEVTHKDPLKVILCNSDQVYREIRNSFFASVFGFLHEKARELVAKSETSGMSVVAIKEFVAKEIRNVDQQKASLALHVGACEVIMKKKTEENFQGRLEIERSIIENLCLKECLNYVEDVINRQDPYVSALRLMCLLSVVQDGLSFSEYRSLATQFRQSYGSKYLIALHNLKKVGLLVEQPPLLPQSASISSKVEKAASMTASKIAEKVVTAFPRYSSFKTIAKKFDLIPDGDMSRDLKNPKDISYVFGGAYVPLIGRITEQIIANDGFKNVEEGMKLLPGSTIVHFKADTDTGHVTPMKDFKEKAVLVYVLGGITYAEVAALRLLEKTHNCRIYIATTSFISGNSLLQMLSPQDAPL